MNVVHETIAPGGTQTTRSYTSLRKVRPESPARSTSSISNLGLDGCRTSWLDRIATRFPPPEAADGLRFFLRRNDVDVIITEDYRPAVIFGLLTRLFGRKARHIVKELYLAEDALTNRWKRSLFRFALRHADCVIVNATSECAAYAEFLRISLDRVVFLPWPSNIPLCNAADSLDAGYIFAAGRSMRDWKTLFACAASLPSPFVIVASRSDLASLPIPPNVTVRCDVSREEYLGLLASAHIVILPLAKTLRSTGQAVALEAMAMRKPLLTADTPGIVNYITDEENGLFYKAEDPESLRQQLQRLLDSHQLRFQLANAGAERVATVFNKDHYREALHDLILTLIRERT